MKVKFIPRLLSEKIMEAHKYFPVIVITGPRQSGKTRLCLELFSEYKYVNLEDLSMRAAATGDPTGFLAMKGNALIIDEVQNVPSLLSMIQVLVDEDSSRRYILTGSSNVSLLDAVTQSLAGRAALFTLLPLSFREMDSARRSEPTSELAISGCYPGVIANDIPPFLFYQNYYNTYVERDIRSLLKVRNVLKFDMFMRLLAARVGTEFNASSMAREVGVSSVTISEWLSILATSYIIYKLPPYHNNASKRLTKMSKVYFYDTGLLCYLNGIETAQQLERHSLRGAVFENLAMGELMKRRLNSGLDANMYFYREIGGKEVDIVLLASAGRELYEVKAGGTFSEDYVANMRSISDRLSPVICTTVIYDGETIAPIAVNIRDI